MRCSKANSVAGIGLGIILTGCSMPSAQSFHDSLPPASKRGYVEFSGERSDYRFGIYEIDPQGKCHRLGIVAGPIEVGEPAIYVEGAGSQRLRVALRPGPRRFTTSGVLSGKVPQADILELDIQEGLVIPVKVFHALVSKSGFDRQLKTIYTVSDPLPVHGLP
jgi:hypothetical protein